MPLPTKHEPLQKYCTFNNIYYQMRKERTISLYTNKFHDDKRHCKEDLKCQGCCACVQQYKNQVKILKEKLGKVGKERDQLEMTAEKMSKRLADFEKRKGEFDNIDDFKLKVRAMIRKQLEEEKKAEEFILKEKTENAKRQKKDFQAVIEKLEKERQLSQKSIKQYQHASLNMKDKISSLQTQLKQKQQEIQSTAAKMKDFKQKQQNFQRILEDKTSIITRMQNALSQTQKNFISEKAKAKNNEFQALRHQQQAKAKALQIHALQRTAEEKSDSIHNLTTQKQKLNKLVVQLDSTVHSYSQLSNHLKQRILISQDYALQKQLQLKHLQMQFYDTLHSRCP